MLKVFVYGWGSFAIMSCLLALWSWFGLYLSDLRDTIPWVIVWSILFWTTRYFYREWKRARIRYKLWGRDVYHG